MNSTARADIVIPVYNERANLPALWARLQALPDFAAYHIIWVDNASTDGSADYLAALPNTTLIRQSHNRGYGHSLRTGYQHCQTERCVVIDADLEYPPECIPELLNQLNEKNVVYASRLQGRAGPAACGMAPLKWFGNWLISRWFNGLFEQDVTDLYTGCKAFRLKAIRNEQFERDGFEHVLEFAASLAGRGYKIAEIPVEFAPRAAGHSKMLHLREIAKFSYWLLRYRFGDALSEQRRTSNAP